MLHRGPKLGKFHLFSLAYGGRVVWELWLENRATDVGQVLDSEKQASKRFPFFVVVMR